MSESPEPRVAIVTGANHGIGAAVAVALANQGVAVVVAYLRLEDAPDPGIPPAYARNRARDANEVLAEVERAGGKGIAVEGDLADPATSAALFDSAEERLGPVSILVNNASAWRADTFKAAESDRAGRRLQPVSADSFDAQMGVDGRAAALLIAEFARRHAARGATWGRIVSLTSGGPLGFPEEVSYGAAKAALENLTMSAAFELAPVGVTANVVHPPVTDTGYVNDAIRAEVAARTDLFRVASPAQVAEVIAWLCSDQAALVTANRIHLR